MASRPTKLMTSLALAPPPSRYAGLDGLRAVIRRAHPLRPLVFQDCRPCRPGGQRFYESNGPFEPSVVFRRAAFREGLRSQCAFRPVRQGHRPTAARMVGDGQGSLPGDRLDRQPGGPESLGLSLLPLVPVLDMRLHAPSDTLFTNTFGRSMWKIDLPAEVE